MFFEISKKKKKKKKKKNLFSKKKIKKKKNMRRLSKLSFENNDQNITSKHLKLLFSITGFVYIFGVLIMYIIESEWNLVHSLYFISMTMSLVGFGDYTPSTGFGQLFISFYCICAVACMYSISWRIARMWDTWLPSNSIKERCIVAIKVLCSITISYTIFFMLIDDIDFFTALYICSNSLGAIGYGNMVPGTYFGRLMFTLFIVIAIPFYGSASYTLMDTLRTEFFMPILDKLKRKLFIFINKPELLENEEEEEEMNDNNQLTTLDNHNHDDDDDDEDKKENDTDRMLNNSNIISIEDDDDDDDDNTFNFKKKKKNKLYHPLQIKRLMKNGLIFFIYILIIVNILSLFLLLFSCGFQTSCGKNNVYRFSTSFWFVITTITCVGYGDEGEIINYPEHFWSQIFSVLMTPLCIGSAIMFTTLFFRKLDSLHINPFHIIKICLYGLTILILYGIITFMMLEHWNFIETFYFIMSTLSTIGYGDYVPTTFTGQIATIPLLFGIYFFTFVLSLMSVLLDYIHEKYTKINQNNTDEIVLSSTSFNPNNNDDDDIDDNDDHMIISNNNIHNDDDNEIVQVTI